MRNPPARSPGATGLFLLVALIAPISCGSPEDAPQAVDPGVVPAVEVVQARAGALPLHERVTGTVRAAGEVAIYPQASGSVSAVLVQNGSAVKEGQPLVRIQAPGSRPLLEQARSNLELSRAEVREAEALLADAEMKYKRARVLGNRGILSVEAVQTLQAEAETARATLAATRAQVNASQAAVAERAEMTGQLTVRAPIAGRVGQRNVEVGMRVDSQTPLFVIGRLDTVRVEVPVTQEAMTRIKTNQRVELDPGGGRPRIAASVSRISPFLAAGSYSAEVEIDVANASGTLVPGMFVPVDIYFGESERATLIPTSALYDHPTIGRQGVFVLSELPPPVPASQPAGAAAELSPRAMPLAFRSVRIIAEGAQTMGVSGLNEGEWVVVVGQHLLSTRSNHDAPTARVRIVSWDRVLELQGLQRHDLLRQFMEKQQRLAAERG